MLKITSIYERIRNLRESKGITQDELACKLGYTSRSSIAKIESGKTDISQTKLKEIASVLDTTTSYLLDGISNKATTTHLHNLSSDRINLLNNYDKLNTPGKQKATERVEELTYIDKYKDINNLPLEEINIDIETKINLNPFEIGKRIKQERERLNLTLKDIALDIGVAISTIQRYENGLIKEIKLPIIQAIANTLSVNPNWLIGKDNSKYIETKTKEITDLNQQRLNDIYNTLTDEYKEKAISLLIELSIECSESQIKKANENKAYMAALGGGVTEISPELAKYITENAIPDKIDN